MDLMTLALAKSGSAGGDMKVKVAGTALAPAADGYVNIPNADPYASGVIKTNDNYGTYLSNGVLFASNKSKNSYEYAPNNMFIGKGTLETVLDNETIRTDTTQSLSDEKKAQARSNIGAGTAERFTVNITWTYHDIPHPSYVYSSDKTFAEVWSAWQAGKIVEAYFKPPTALDSSGTRYELRLNGVYDDSANTGEKSLIFTSDRLVGDGMHSLLWQVSMFYNGTNYSVSASKVTILDADYAQRQAITRTVTIAVADWNSTTTCTKNVTGVTANNIVICDSSDTTVQCTAQGAGTLTFTADATPTAVVTVKVVILP